MESTRMLALSIDVPALTAEHPLAPLVSAHVDAVLHAAELFQVPLTWCVADVSQWHAVDRIRHSRCRHELAILAGPEWFASRNQTAKLLAQHVDHAAARGLRPTLLALEGLHTVSELDLLVRHQIRVVRDPLARSADRRPSHAAVIRPLSVRFGVWLAPVHYVYGGHITWWLGGNRWAIYKLARLVKRGPAVVSLALDPVRAARDQVDLGQLAVRIFRWLDRARRRKTITLMPLSQAVLAVAQSQSNVGEGMQSVLRRSA